MKRIIIFIFGAATFFLLSPLLTAEKSCDELLPESEGLWMKMDYDGSDRSLAEAEKLCPERSEIYWRKARNQYDRYERIPRGQKPPKKDLIEVYQGIEAWAAKCTQVDEKDGNCWLWKAVGMGRRGTNQDILKTLLEVDDLVATIQKAIALKPAYRSSNGIANSRGDLYSMLGIIYRVLPEWTCRFPFKQVIGVCGNLEKSVELQRSAVAQEPERAEYLKELGISLMCFGEKRGKPEAVEEARRILNNLQSWPDRKNTDPVDKEHSRMLLEHPDQACSYSRDTQMEKEEEDLRKKK